MRKHVLAFLSKLNKSRYFLYGYTSNLLQPEHPNSCQVHMVSDSNGRQRNTNNWRTSLRLNLIFEYHPPPAGIGPGATLIFTVANRIRSDSPGTARLLIMVGDGIWYYVIISESKYGTWYAKTHTPAPNTVRGSGLNSCAEYIICN